MGGTLEWGESRDMRVQIHILEEVSCLPQRRDMDDTTHSMARQCCLFPCS
jgi:hypothetical protein